MQQIVFQKSINRYTVFSLIRHKDLYGTGVFLLFVMLIGYQEMISPSIGIFILIVLTEGIFFRSLRFVFNPALMLFVGLYLLYLVGLLWSEHPAVGWKLLEYKMSFFIFPILFLFPKKGADYQVYLRGIVWGALVLAIRFFIEKMKPSGSQTFYDISRVELNLHPTYTAIYFACAIVFICWSVKQKMWKMNPIIAALLCVIFSGMILATASFAGIIFLGILLTIGLGWIIFRYLKKTALIVYIFLAPILMYLALTQLKSLAYDLEIIGQLKTEIMQGKEEFLEKNKTTVSGNRERVMLWFISAEIIGENPFGVGTGDIDFHLQEKCDKYELQVLKDQNLNPHNQYFQIGIDVGIPGILYLVFMLICFFVKAVKFRNMFFALMVLNMAFNALFESVLQRQSGIVFFTLLICVLLVAEASRTNGNKTTGDLHV